ncbi:MAG: methyltransferase domain-containing protein [Betaproteobacteria bacterium]|nr:methyltransferase domain-containing protein [Betaproteobacteria bacterium]
MSISIDFFETQFRKQVSSGEMALNPFETLALPYLQGRLLDFGCGLGNLALAAARRGCSVLALDAAPTAIRHLTEVSLKEGLMLKAALADLRTYRFVEDFDAVVSIGLLMFFDCATARHQLEQLQASVRPGGIAAINVLIQGTSYLDMFDPASCCLFAADEMRARFVGWEILCEKFDDFPAPGETIKSFVTFIARKPKNETNETAQESP